MSYESGSQVTGAAGAFGAAEQGAQLVPQVLTESSGTQEAPHGC